MSALPPQTHPGPRKSFRIKTYFQIGILLDGSGSCICPLLLHRTKKICFILSQIFIKHETEDVTSTCVCKSVTDCDCDCDCDSSLVPPPSCPPPRGLPEQRPKHHTLSPRRNHANTTAGSSRLLRSVMQTPASPHIMIYCKILQVLWKFSKQKALGKPSLYLWGNVLTATWFSTAKQLWKETWHTPPTHLIPQPWLQWGQMWDKLLMQGIQIPWDHLRSTFLNTWRVLLKNVFWVWIVNKSSTLS